MSGSSQDRLERKPHSRSAAGVGVAGAAAVLLVVCLGIVPRLTEPYRLLMAALAVALLVLVYAWLRVDPHLARTQEGWALIRTLRLPDKTRVRVLRQGGVYQSATYLDERRFEPVFAYQRAFDVLFETEGTLRAVRGSGVAHVLAIGGGGYAWPKHTLMHHPDLQMDVVEIDGAVTEIARRWFFVDELQRMAGDRLQLVTADGRAFIEDAPRAAYDAVVNDTFAGGEPVRALASVEALRTVRACLVPNGLYLANVVSRDEGEDLTFLRDTVATCAALFARVWVVPATDEDLGGEDNYIVIASDGDYSFADAVPFDEEFLGTEIHDGSD